jgi:hypothetical protein
MFWIVHLLMVDVDDNRNLSVKRRRAGSLLENNWLWRSKSNSQKISIVFVRSASRA